MRKALNSIFAVVTVRKGDGGFRIRTNKTTPRVSNIKGAIVRFKKKIKKFLLVQMSWKIQHRTQNMRKDRLSKRTSTSLFWNACLCLHGPPATHFYRHTPNDTSLRPSQAVNNGKGSLKHPAWPDTFTVRKKNCSASKKKTFCFK